MSRHRFDSFEVSKQADKTGYKRGKGRHRFDMSGQEQKVQSTQAADSSTGEPDEDDAANEFGAQQQVIETKPVKAKISGRQLVAAKLMQGRKKK